MISKVVQRKTGDNYGRLALYLAAAKDPGEKLDQFWMVNCDVGSELIDLDLAIADIEATQNLNVLSKGEKTYHLVVSFKNEKPSPDALRDIEQEFAKALGFDDHQRIVATHQNTDNFHMHVAYNKIHPKTLLNHFPGWDYKKREKVCREMEKKYDLQVDLGKAEKLVKGQQIPELSVGAKDYEAKTWEQSFESYVKENKTALSAIGKGAKSWKDIQTGFAKYGLEFKKLANGLVIIETDGKRAMRASALDRQFSKSALEGRIGPFQEPDKKRKPTKPPKKRYQRKPITTHPKQSIAWNKYLGRIKRKESLAMTAYRNWKDFLVAEALSDPLAMAIMVYHKKLLKGVENLLDVKKNHSYLPLSSNKYKKIEGLELKKEKVTTGRVQKARHQSYETWNRTKTWANAKNCSYLKKNDIGGYGVKIAWGGDIIIPLRDTSGKLHNLYRITKTGGEYIKGGRKKDLFHTIDPKRSLSEKTKNKKATIALIAEDYASAATLHEATGKPVIVALKPDNLVPVLKELQKQHPTTQFIMAPNKNRSYLPFEEITVITLPETPKEPSIRNWRELAAQKGKGAAHRMIRRQLSPALNLQNGISPEKGRGI